ncbi:MAG: YraN family protein [Rickettsiales bacterium]|jgi:putative endonuclease|nr:YraN family protein [Rickettsiales bacterium]
MNSYRYGLFAEYFIIFYLFIRGYRILARRYKTKLGEIDIIATKKDNLVAFEIKARKGKGLTTEIVNNRQLLRINNALRFFLYKNNKYLDYNILIYIILYKNIFNFKIFKQEE